MNRNEQKEALDLIKLMLGARLNSQSAIGPDTVKGYLLAVSDCSFKAIEAACVAFIKGNVEGFNNDYAPSGPRLAEEARKWDEAYRMVEASREARSRDRIVAYKIGELPPPPATPLGPTKLEIGGIMTNVSDWSYEEKEEAMRTDARPKSRQLTGPADAALGKARGNA